VPLCAVRPLRTVTPTLALAAGVMFALLLPGTARAEPSASDLSQQLSQANQQLDVVVERFDQTTVRLADLSRQSVALQGRLVPVEAAVHSYAAQLSTLITGLYEQGATANLSALLSADSPGTALDQLTTAEYLAHQRAQLLAGYRTARTDLVERQDELDLLTAQIHNQQASLAAQKVAIEAKIAALKELRRKLYGTSTPTPARVDSYVPPYQAGPAGVAVQYAYAQIGKAYQYGAAGPNTYDCSGLTMASWAHAGVSLPHSAAQQWRVVSHLAKSQLQPGDLVFYYSDIHHVAIYIGAGRIVHAPTWGQDVTTASLNLAPIYGYGRVKA